MLDILSGQHAQRLSPIGIVCPARAVAGTFPLPQEDQHGDHPCEESDREKERRDGDRTRHVGEVIGAGWSCQAHGARLA